MRQLELAVHGRVQGVGFRNMVLRRALELGSRGWVRNEKDGTVRILAQGGEGVLREFRDWISDGPGISSVHGIDEDWVLPKEEYATFIVIRESGFLRDQFHSMRNLVRRK